MHSIETLKMEIERFLTENAHQQLNGRNRTINIKEELHSYYKKVAAHYNVNMSTLITNVLLNWKEENEDDIREDMIKKLNS